VKSIKLIFIAILLAILSVQSSQAQSGVDLLTGYRPFGSYQHGDVDTIDLSNGRPLIDIPLISYPQRGGKLQLNYVLRYHSPSHSVTGNSEVLGGMTGCLPSAFGGNCIVFPWDSGFSGITETGAVFASATCTGGAPYSYDCGGVVFSADGSHPMAPIGPNSFRAADGTGYRLDVPGGFPTNLSGPTPNLSHVITDTNGVRYWVSSDMSTTITEDTNGNQIVGGSGNGVTDTIGRVIPASSGFPVPFPSTWPTGIGTTDFRDCSGPLPIVGAIAWNPPGIYGGTYSLKFCFVSISEIMPADQYNSHPNYSTTAIQLQSVVLPNKTTWTFQYETDGSGNLSQITLPTGGTISYTWINATYPGAYPEYVAFPAAVATRTLNPNDGTPSAVWQYHYTRIIGQDYPVVTRVTDPTGVDTVHTFGSPGVGGTFYLETLTQFYKTSAAAGILLKTVQTDYQSMIARKNSPFGIGQTVVPIRMTTIWPNGQQSKIEQDYDAGFRTYDTTYDPSGNWVGGGCSICGGSLYGQITSTREYGLGTNGPGSLLRTTSTPHLALSNTAYFNNNLLGLLSSKAVTDAANNPVELTSFAYDEPALPLIPSGITAQHNLNPASGSARGNLTSTSRWLNSTGGSLISQSSWFDTGSLQQEIDPLGHKITHSYDSYYAGAYRTKTCNPTNQCVSATYDFNTGLPTSFSDANSSFHASGNTLGDPAHTTSYSYDSMLRMKLAQSPADPDNGGVNPNTQFNYSLPNVFPYTVQRLTAITSGLSDSITTTYDGLGRPTKTEHMTPSGNAIVDKQFDGLNRVTVVSNPYLVKTEPTYGTTTYTYEALGRITNILRQDGSTFQFQYIDPSTTLTTDESGHQLRKVTDALGRLIEVDEPPVSGLQVNDHATLQSDGNFVLSNAANSALWSTGTGGTNASSIYMQDDGNLVLYIFKWSAGTYAAPTPGSYPAQSCSIGTYLVVNQRINANQCIVSPHGQYMLYMGPDGNFYIYDIAHGVGTWGPGTYGHNNAYAILQGDGNLCVYTATNVYLWCSGTNGTFAERLNMEDDGRIIIYKSAWNSGTSDGQFNWAFISHPSCDIGIGTGSTGVIGSAQCFVSPNGRFELLMQTDGNMVIYDRSVTPNAALWSSGTAVSPTDPTVAMRTLYAYDALDNLICVEQHGSASTGTGCPAAPPGPTDPPVQPDPNNAWRRRLFAYDSLSRLRWTSNPESGVISYSYDSDGSLLQKTSPAPNQIGTATQTISYCYDALHRVTGKAYSAQSCPLSAPVVTYVYDSGANAIGHLTSLIDQAGTALYTYDVFGRLTTETRPIAGVSKSTSFTYTLDSSVKTLTYPSGRVVTYTPDSARRLTSAVDSNGTQYVSSATYYASDAEYQRFMPGIYFRTDLNPRLQVSGFYSDNGQISSFFANKTYSYGPLHQNNGNVMSITNNKDSNRTQTFAYDGLNRIASGSSSANTGTFSWGENYSIDAWGNLQISPMGGKAHGGNFAHSGNPQNRPTGLAYDAAGNLMSYLSATYAYDQENRLSSAAGTSYTYDGTGDRILKSNTSTGAPIKRYWSMNGNLLAEGDGSGNLTAEYIYFGSKRVARIDLPSNSVHYYLSDHLGSTSIVVSAGTIEEESDYSPFGTETIITGPGVNKLKFTGKERDSESGNDYFGARYYGSAMGRFMWPDPSGLLAAKPASPQSWNLYAYATNNPLIYIDPTGLDCVYANDAGNGVESIDHNSSSGECGGSGGSWVPGYANENWAHFNNTTQMFQVGSINGSDPNATVDYTMFEAGSRTQFNENESACLSGCSGFSLADANWLLGQLVGNSIPGGLGGYIQFLTGREEPLHGGALNQLVSGPLDSSTDHWAGPGGFGPPGGQGDWAASVHDYNFNTNRITIGDYFNPNLSPATRKALIQSDGMLIRNAGGVQGVKMGLFFGTVNAFQRYAGTFK
jgi:RHS repeat-associated protein